MQGLRALGIQRMKMTLQQLRRLYYAPLRVRRNRQRRAHRLELRRSILGRNEAKTRLLSEVRDDGAEHYVV